MRILLLLLSLVLLAQPSPAQTNPRQPRGEQKPSVMVDFEGTSAIGSAVASSLRSALERSERFAPGMNAMKSTMVVEIKVADLSDLKVDGNWAAISIVALSKGRRIYHEVHVIGARKAEAFGREVLEDLEERFK